MGCGLKFAGIRCTMHVPAISHGIRCLTLETLENNMNKRTLSLAALLLLASASAWSATDGTPDLTYCLQLQSNIDIAKCAGETTTRNKGKPMSKEDVAEMLNRERQAAEKAPAPATVSEPAMKPAAEKLQ